MLVSPMTAENTANGATGGVCATRTLSEPPHIKYADQLLKWIYVISIGRFVHMDDLQLQRSEAQFNELYSPTRLPNGMKPSRFVRHVHQDTNKVDRLESWPTLDKRIGYDDFGLRLFNVFRPPPSPPPESLKDVGPKLAVEHLRWICNGDADALEHLLKWMAYTIFKPGDRMHHGVLLSGAQGTGKSTIGLMMKHLIGPSAKVIGPKELNAKFNTWMLDTRFAIIEEVKVTNDYSLYNKIKTNFTNETIRIEPKNLSDYEIRNHIAYMMFSNSTVPFPMELDDRRIFFIWSKVEKQTAAYYAELYDYLFQQDGIWAFREYLRDKVLPHCPAGFATLPPPQSKDHQDLAIAGLNPIEEFLREALENGEGLYAPEVFFLKKEFDEYLRHEKHLQSALRNTSEKNDILRKLKFDSKRKIIDGKKETFAWFDRDGWGDRLEAKFNQQPAGERKRLLEKHLVKINLWGDLG